MWRLGRRTTIALVAAVLAPAVACGADDGAPETGRQRMETVGLAEAFAATAEATSYRLTNSVGQTISSSAMGVDTSTEADPEDPMMVMEVTPEGTHTSADLSKLFGPMMGQDLGSIGFEIWVDEDRMVVDTRGYAALLNANPGAELGPFEPGVSYVDLDALGLESPDLVTAAVGAAMPDLRVMAERLPQVLDGVEQTGTTFTGVASYADVLEALGADLDHTSRGAAAGVALNLDVEVDELAAIYASFYEEIPFDVTVVVTSTGILRSVHYQGDLSGIYQAIFDHPEALGLDVSDEELEQARELFADTEWTLEALLQFEVVEDLELPPAPEATEDRTDEWITFLREAGL